MARDTGGFDFPFESETGRTFADPVDDELLADPEPKTFGVEFEADGRRDRTTVDTLTEKPNTSFFEERLGDVRQDVPGDVDVLDFRRKD